MNDKEIVLTAEGLSKIETELDELKTNHRREVNDRIRQAKDHRNDHPQVARRGVDRVDLDRGVAADQDLPAVFGNGVHGVAHRADRVLRVLAVGDGAERGLDLHLAIDHQRRCTGGLRPGAGRRDDGRITGDPSTAATVATTSARRPPAR